MIIGSILAIAKKNTEIAVGGLGLVIISQWIGYGLIFDSNFFFRNLSVAGGLLMLLADSYSSKKRLFSALPTLNQTDKSTYLQLFGRILLVFLFLSFVFSGEFSILRLIISIIGLIGCVLVVIGFKAKYTAWILITLLSISNVLLNNWWSLHHAHPRRYLLLIVGISSNTTFSKPFLLWGDSCCWPTLVLVAYLLTKRKRTFNKRVEHT